jgi:hypothetical protein
MKLTALVCWLCLSSNAAAFSTVAAGGQKLKIAENAAVSPIGGIVWDASKILCDHLAKLAADGQLVDQRMLELGSGTGICGILAWVHGATGVLTDMDRSDKATGKHTFFCFSFACNALTRSLSYAQVKDSAQDSNAALLCAAHDRHNAAAPYGRQH